MYFAPRAPHLRVVGCVDVEIFPNSRLSIRNADLLIPAVKRCDHPNSNCCCRVPRPQQYNEQVILPELNHAAALGSQGLHADLDKKRLQFEIQDGAWARLDATLLCLIIYRCKGPIHASSRDPPRCVVLRQPAKMTGTSHHRLVQMCLGMHCSVDAGTGDRGEPKNKALPQRNPTKGRHGQLIDFNLSPSPSCALQLSSRSHCTWVAPRHVLDTAQCPPKMAS